MNIARKIVSFRTRPRLWKKLKEAANFYGMPTDRYAECLLVTAHANAGDLRVHRRTCVRCQTKSANAAIEAFREAGGGVKPSLKPHKDDPRGSRAAIKFFREATADARYGGVAGTMNPGSVEERRRRIHELLNHIGDAGDCATCQNLPMGEAPAPRRAADALNSGDAVEPVRKDDIRRGGTRQR